MESLAQYIILARHTPALVYVAGSAEETEKFVHLRDKIKALKRVRAVVEVANYLGKQVKEHKIFSIPRIFPEIGYLMEMVSEKSTCPQSAAETALWAGTLAAPVIVLSDEALEQFFPIATTKFRTDVFPSPDEALFAALRVAEKIFLNGGQPLYRVINGEMPVAGAVGARRKTAKETLRNTFWKWGDGTSGQVFALIADPLIATGIPENLGQIPHVLLSLSVVVKL